MQSSPAVKNLRVQLCDKATAFLHYIKHSLDHTNTHTHTHTNTHTHTYTLKNAHNHRKTQSQNYTHNELHTQRNRKRERKRKRVRNIHISEILHKLQNICRGFDIFTDIHDFFPSFHLNIKCSRLSQSHINI